MNTEVPSHNHCCRGEGKSMKCYECVSVLLPSLIRMKFTTLLRVIICHLCPVWLYHVFPHYIINDTIFGKKLLDIKCLLWYSLQLLSETFLTLRSIKRDIIINLRWSSYKMLVILVRLYSNLNFFNKFRKILKYKISLRSVQWGRVVLWGQTDMTKLVFFRNLANSPKKKKSVLVTPYIF
jgi:hypothetical protein